MELFYNNLSNNSGSIAEFDDFERQHIVRTYRKKISDIIFFTDGNGNLYQGEITEVKPKLKTNYSLIKSYESPAKKSALGIGYIRPTRLDFIFEKGTELGINIFFLFACEYSNYFTKNITRWVKITRQAIKQSNRYFLPEIIIFNNFSLYLDTVEKIKHKFLANHDATQFVYDTLQSLKLQNGEDILFTIGPEGGFNKSELTLAEKFGLNFVSFGENIVRTETAAIAAASYMNLLNSDVKDISTRD